MDEYQRYIDIGSLRGINIAMQNGLEKNLKFSEMNLNDEKFRKYLRLFLCSSIGGHWRRKFDYENGKTPWYKSVQIISKDNLKNKELIKKIIKY